MDGEPHAAEPDREAERLGTLATISAVVVSAEFIALAWLFGFVTPRLREIFADFDTDLPHVTLLVFGVPDWAFAGLLGFFALFVIAKEFVIPSRVSRLTITLSMALLGAFLSVFYGFAMVMPLVKLIRSVSQ